MEIEFMYIHTYLSPRETVYRGLWDFSLRQLYRIHMAAV